MTEGAQAIRLKDFDDINEELDFLFGTYFQNRRPVLMAVNKGWQPPTDVFETEDEIVIIMDIAGISIKDVSLSLDKNLITLRGIRREHGGDIKRRYHSMEIDFGPFEKNIELTSHVDPEKTKAKYFRGFLEIRLLKCQDRSIAKVNIEIK